VQMLGVFQECMEMYRNGVQIGIRLTITGKPKNKSLQVHRGRQVEWFVEGVGLTSLSFPARPVGAAMIQRTASFSRDSA
jgi:hypothetical protein